MKQRVHGMILLTTMCLLSIVTCFWLSSMHLLLLLKKTTYQLQERRATVRTLEHGMTTFIQEQSPEMLAACIHQTCSIPSGVVLQVEKMSCYPCLAFQKKGEVLGSQHWLIRATFQEKRLFVRLATPALCGVCTDDIVFLRSPVLSWYLYP